MATDGRGARVPDQYSVMTVVQTLSGLAVIRAMTLHIVIVCRDPSLRIIVTGIHFTS